MADIIDRSKLSGLIPEPVTREIIQGAVTESAVLRMARRLPNMTSKTQTLNVLDALPTAYFVNGEATTGASDSKASLKKTTNMAWDKKKIYAAQTVCGICGKPVDFSLKYPHPLSACIDHIIPIAKGGHPSDIENMQLAHWTCNRQKSDHLVTRKEMKEEVISNRVLPHTFDWLNYRSK